MRIVTAMSGGVDSSVAAALLSEQGHEVIGLSMQLYDQREGGADFGSCCSIDDLEDARRVASLLRIPHYIVNFEKQFDAQVISPFVREYTMARTPIPGVQCNGGLKFTNLLERAKCGNTPKPLAFPLQPNQTATKSALFLMATTPLSLSAGLATTLNLDQLPARMDKCSVNTLASTGTQSDNEKD